MNVKSTKGITLVALVITIIVILILVGVTVDIAIDGKLFDKAEDTVQKANQKIKQEEKDTDELLNEWDDIENVPGNRSDDLAAPTVNFFKYTPGEWTNEDIKIQLSSLNKGIVYEYSNDGINWNECSSNITINEDQDQNYRFRVKNAEGKTSLETEVYNVKRDTVPPTIEIATKDEFGKQYIDVSVTNSNDIGSGIIEYTYSHKFFDSRGDGKDLEDYRK